jgi:hypothetical protein
VAGKNKGSALTLPLFWGTPRKNDPHKTQKYGDGLSPSPYFWIQLFCDFKTLTRFGF